LVFVGVSAVGGGARHGNPLNWRVGSFKEVYMIL
jgi:hypothetical protein